MITSVSRHTPRALNRVLAPFVVLLCLIGTTSDAQEAGRKNAKDSGSWSAEEYSGLRGQKEIQTAMMSKAFTWITGSPADNEKLSIGKNAQFFGFVALRYQSGRAANRGLLGRAMFSIATEAQREIMADAVGQERVPLDGWWSVRDEILSLLEDHLYTGTPVDESKLSTLGEQFSLLNSTVATYEARAYAAFEDLVSPEQTERIKKWRSDPALANEYGQSVRVQDDRLDRENWKLLEDLYAKCFSWISGRREDNEIIPIGQPAQFFGFVSIRHKSGRGANRGKIASDFQALLDANQRAAIDGAVEELIPLIREFLEARHLYLDELETLRFGPDGFDSDEVDELARRMGRLEMTIAKLEAGAYRRLRVSMSDEQLRAAMDMRAEYVINQTQVELLETNERGAALAVLCTGCHGTPGTWRTGMLGPNLDGIWDRPIASGGGFAYSEALRALSGRNGTRWTAESLDAFLAGPAAFAPGTKMEFQGLLNPDDRRAIIRHLETY